MENLNNSFPCYFGHEQLLDNFELMQQERISNNNHNVNNISAFNLDFSKFYDSKINYTQNCPNFSPSKKKNSLELSYLTEQNSYETSSNINIENIEEEFGSDANEETCKINLKFYKPRFYILNIIIFSS
jgi:hypothetical protein